MSLTTAQEMIVNAVEQAYWETGKFPTNEILSELSGVAVKTIEGYWKDADFRKVLTMRGLDLSGLVSDTKLLTGQQLMVANMLLNIYDKRSDREKFAEAGVTSQQVNAWRRDPTFQNYLSKRAEAVFAGSDPDAYKALVETVKGGDVSAIKLYLEMRGKYNPRMQIEVNVDSILIRVIEVISRHVTDPSTLEAIASDLEGLAPRPIDNSAKQLVAAQVVESVENGRFGL